MQIASDKGKLLFQLDKICKDVNIPLHTELNPTEIMKTIENKIIEIKTLYPTYNSHNFPTILSNQNLQINLNSQQLQRYNLISEAIFNVSVLLMIRVLILSTDYNYFFCTVVSITYSVIITTYHLLI